MGGGKEGDKVPGFGVIILCKLTPVMLSVKISQQPKHARQALEITIRNTLAATAGEGGRGGQFCVELGIPSRILIGVVPEYPHVSACCHEQKKWGEGHWNFSLLVQEMIGSKKKRKIASWF